MLANVQKGEKVVCNTDSLLIGKNNISTPKKHEIVTVCKVRIYQNIGWCISLEEYDHEVFFHISGFDHKDSEFAENILRSLRNGRT